MPETCAIVGGGLAGFVAHATLRKGGLPPAEIAVFGTDSDPAAVWRVRAAAIRQRRMRSESDGHCGPTTLPRARRAGRAPAPELVPLVQSAFDRYHPTVKEFLDHVAELACDDRVGRELPGRPHPMRARRRGRVRARRAGRLPPHPPGARAPGARLPGRARRRSARRSRLPAARVRRAPGGRRGGHGRRDRVAERARGGLLGRLGAAARAGAAPAQPPARALHAARPRRVSPNRAGRAARAPRGATASRPTRWGAPGTGRSRRPGGRDASRSPRSRTGRSR